MVNWIKQHYDLGPIKENTKSLITYTYTTDLSIVEITPSCGSCTSVIHDINNKQVRATFTVGNIPKHLRNIQDYVDINKSITVTFENNVIDILSFSGRIIK
jgi:hypothetical protein